MFFSSFFWKATFVKIVRIEKDFFSFFFFFVLYICIMNCDPFWIAALVVIVLWLAVISLSLSLLSFVTLCHVWWPSLLADTQSLVRALFLLLYFSFVFPPPKTNTTSKNTTAKTNNIATRRTPARKKIRERKNHCYKRKCKKRKLSEKKVLAFWYNLRLADSRVKVLIKLNDEVDNLGYFHDSVSTTWLVSLLVLVNF